MPAVTIDMRSCTALSDVETAEAWQLYRAAFQELEVRAAQRHLMTEEEFRAVVADPRVIKHIAHDADHGGRAIAMCTATNQLSAMPLISEAYYAHRWPEQHARGLVHYIGFCGVHPHYRGSGVLAAIVERVCAPLLERGGVAALDICRYNDEHLQLPRAISRLAGNLSAGARTVRLDEQVFWAYEFPDPVRA